VLDPAAAVAACADADNTALARTLAVAELAAPAAATSSAGALADPIAWVAADADAVKTAVALVAAIAWVAACALAEIATGPLGATDGRSTSTPSDGNERPVRVISPSTLR
jgi:hypothetical protein